jgi:hypothetical protein
MAMQQLQGSGRDVPTEVNLRRAAKIITSELLRRLRNTDLVDDPARLEAADRIEALENALREIVEAGDFWEMDSIARKALAEGQDAP